MLTSPGDVQLASKPLSKWADLAPDQTSEFILLTSQTARRPARCVLHLCSSHQWIKANPRCTLVWSLPRSPAAYIPSTGYWLQTGSWFCLLGPVNKLSITSGIISLSWEISEPQEPCPDTALAFNPVTDRQEPWQTGWFSIQAYAWWSGGRWKVGESLDSCS